MDSELLRKVKKILEEGFFYAEMVVDPNNQKTKKLVIIAEDFFVGIMDEKSDGTLQVSFIKDATPAYVATLIRAIEKNGIKYDLMEHFRCDETGKVIYEHNDEQFWGWNKAKEEVNTGKIEPENQMFR